jgi:hypothetical protein
MNNIIKYLGNGEFQITLHETGEVKGCGPNLLGMVKYTYFENDDTYPPIGWEVTQKQLLEDYQPKVMKDLIQGGNNEQAMIDYNKMEEEWEMDNYNEMKDEQQ